MAGRVKKEIEFWFTIIRPIVLFWKSAKGTYDGKFLVTEYGKYRLKNLPIWEKLLRLSPMILMFLYFLLLVQLNYAVVFFIIGILIGILYFEWNPTYSILLFIFFSLPIFPNVDTYSHLLNLIVGVVEGLVLESIVIWSSLKKASNGALVVIEPGNQTLYKKLYRAVNSHK